MSFYRSLLAAVAALALALPAFADETPAATDQAAQPAAAAQPAETNAAAPAAAASEQVKVDLNKATVKELTKVKGISPAKAKAIVAYRKKNGDFKSVDDLKNVKGFKKLNADQMKGIQDQLTAG